MEWFQSRTRKFYQIAWVIIVRDERFLWKKHIYNVWLSNLTKFQALANLKPQERCRLRTLISEQMQGPYYLIILSEESLFNSFQIYTRHPCKAGSLNLLLLERSSNQVMEENRVFLYVSLRGHQFGPQKNIQGRMTSCTMSMCFPSSVVQHCGLSSVVEAAYCNLVPRSRCVWSWNVGSGFQIKLIADTANKLYI